MSAEKELLELRYKLDYDEYDDEEEFDNAMNEFYPDTVFEVAGRAAKEGATTGMHLYGIMLAQKAGKIKESGEDAASILREARDWVEKAAKNGCWGAMDDLATEQTELLDVPIETRIAFFKLSGSGGDLNEYINYLREDCGEEITEEQVGRGLELYEKLSVTAVDKRMCDCIFP